MLARHASGMGTRRGWVAALIFASTFLISGSALAEEAPKMIDTGDTAWMLT